MNQIRISYKGSMDKLNLFDLLEKIDINSISQIEVEKNFNIWPETSLKFYIEFRNDDIFMISRGEDKRVKQDHHAKIENEQQIGISDFQLFYRLFEILNLSKVKVSSIESTKIIIDELELFIRYSSELGAFWEIRTSLPIKSYKKIKETKVKIEQFIDRLSLQYWEQEQQSKTVETSKHNFINSRYSFQDGWKDLQERIIRYLREVRSFKRIDEITGNGKPRRIVDKLQIIDNDFSLVERMFKQVTGSELVKPEKRTVKTAKQSLFLEKLIKQKSISFIVPFFNDSNRIKLLLQSISKQDVIQNNVVEYEVIIVDDGSNNEEKKQLGHTIESLKSATEINLITLQRNAGRSNARNVGAQIARGEILFFVDSDIVLSNNYVFEHLIVHSIFSKVVTVSMKENISSHDKRLNRLEEDEGKVVHFVNTQKQVTISCSNC